jgi:cyclic dehypoxanthinyl futalosine synthase
MGITRQQALDCFASDDLIGIGMEADAVRRRLHPDGVVSYAVGGRLDLRCFVTPESRFDLDAVRAEAAEAVELGCTGVLLHADPAKLLALSAFETLFSTLKLSFPDLRLHGLSAATILALAAISALSVEETLRRLQASGLDSISDSGPLEPDSLQVHRTAHQLGMTSSVTFLFGGGESFEQRVQQLDALRRLQQETGGFTSVTPAAIQPVSGSSFEEATAVEYLKTLAITRMFLDGIEHVQASLPTQGLKVVQMGLRFGGNDLGSVELGSRQKREGVSLGATEEELRRIIRDAGFRPVQRDPLFRTMFLN